MLTIKEREQLAVALSNMSRPLEEYEKDNKEYFVPVRDVQNLLDTYTEAVKEHLAGGG